MKLFIGIVSAAALLTAVLALSPGAGAQSGGYYATRDDGTGSED